MSATDAELVTAARGGNRAAFATLLARHRVGLLAACGRLLRDDALAEDAAQEAAVVAYLSLGRLRDPQRFGAWLVGIGLNIGRRWLRARGRRQPLSLSPRDGEALPAPGPGPDEIAEARELGARVRRAVQALPPGQRGAVVGHYLLGLSQREVATLLGTSPGAVKTRLHKARAALAGALAEGIPIEEDDTMTDTGPVEVRVADVCRVDHPEHMSRCVVILEEIGGPRTLPIWIGEPEGTALAAALMDAELPRPMTHALAAGLLDVGGVALRGVRITRLAQHTFYATITIDGARGPRDVDARPSDALTLAVLAEAPVTIDQEVLRIAEAQVSQEGVPTVEQVRAEAQQRAGDIVEAALAEWDRLVADLRQC